MCCNNIKQRSWDISAQSTHTHRCYFKNNDPAITHDVIQLHRSHSSLYRVMMLARKCCILIDDIYMKFHTIKVKAKEKGSTHHWLMRCKAASRCVISSCTFWHSLAVCCLSQNLIEYLKNIAWAFLFLIIIIIDQWWIDFMYSSMFSFVGIGFILTSCLPCNICFY